MKGRIVKILFRVDGHYAVGMGHISRCIALAHTLKGKGAKPFFLIRDHDTARDVLENNRMEYLSIGRDLGIKEETEVICRVIKKHLVDVLIVDLRSTPSGYLTPLKKSGAFIVHIDDFERSEAEKADMVVATESERTDRKHNSLRGIKYVILEKKFKRYNGTKKKRYGEAKDILLSFGGGDNALAFVKVIKAMERLGYKGKITLIIGATFRKYDVLDDLLEGTALKVKVLRNTDKMHSLLRKTDIAFLSGGLTKYEASCVGTPALVVCQENIQFGTTSRFARDFGSVINLGKSRELTIKKVLDEFERVTLNKKMLARMGKKGQEAVDGLGAERIAERILSPRGKARTVLNGRLRDE